MGYYNGDRIVTNGLVLSLDAADKNSYIGSGTVMNDLTNNNNTGNLTNGPTFSTSNIGIIVLDGTNDHISIPNYTKTYYDTNFTWQMWHYMKGFKSGLNGFIWAETAGNKNYLFGYDNYGGNTFNVRFDTSATSYVSGAGNGTKYALVDSLSLVNRWEFTTIVKEGTLLSLYWSSGLLLWTATLASWLTPSTTVATVLGAKNDGTFASNINIASFIAYNRALTSAEISRNYNAQKSRFGL